MDIVEKLVYLTSSFFLISTVSTTDGSKNKGFEGKEEKEGRTKIDFQRGALLLSWIGQVVTVTVLYTDRRRSSE